jgi:hypothetical protein
MLLRTPGSRTRVKSVAAQGPDFSLYAADLRNGKPAGEDSPLAIIAWIAVGLS